MTNMTKENRNEISEDDPIETTIGSFGRSQFWIYVLVLVTQICIYYQVVNVVFLLPSVDYICLDGADNATKNVCPCENPLYDNSVFQETVASKWNLICDHKWISSLSQGILQIGVLVGSVLYGYMCDRYGRKLSVVSSVFSGAIFVVATGLTPELWSFMAFRFLSGVSSGGNYMSTFTLQMEIIGKSFRPYMVMMQEVSYIMAYMSIAGIGYLFRDFQHMQLVVSVPWIMTFLFYWILPESPRWLMAKGRTKEAIDLLTKMAIRNQRPVDKIESVINAYQEKTSNVDGDSASMKDLFRIKEMRKLVLSVSMLWICTSYSFFGMGQYLGRLNGDVFMNVLVTSSLHIPAVFVLLFLLLNVKRRTSIIIFLALTGLSTFSFMFIPSSSSIARLSVTIIAVNCLYALIILLYLYNCEIFPTVVRSSAMGIASMLARFGAFASPFVVDTNNEYVILGSYTIAMIVGITMFIWLPETKDRALLNTIDDALKSNKDSKKSAI